MNERKLNGSTYPYQFFMAGSSDHVTGMTGLAPTVQLSKNGAAFAPASGPVSEMGFGWYSLGANATDRNALGACAIHASSAGCDPFDGKITVVPWDPFDPNLSLAALPGVAAGTAGGLPTVDGSNSVKLQVGTGPNQISLTAGAVNAGTVADKAGYSLATSPPTAAQIASAILATPANLLQTNATGYVTTSNPASGGSAVTEATIWAYATRSLTAGVAVTTNNDKLGYSLSTPPPTAAQVAGAILATPTNLIQTDTSGRVAANNLPADYQQRGAAVTLPATPPTGYGGSSGLTASQVATAVWTDTTAADFAVAGSPGKAVSTNLDVNVGSRSTYAGGPVASVTGNVGGSVGSLAGVSFPANFAVMAIAPGGAVTAGTVADKAGYQLASNGVDAVIVESGVNARQAVSAILASSVGVLSGAATNIVTIQGGNVPTTRITATVDASGNRPSVALNLPA